MARKPRVQDSGMIHHVIVRGNNSQDIFKDDNDRIRYLHLLHRYKERFKFKILAYCFMDNHIHLLLKQSDTSLSKFMAGIQQSYTQYFNFKYNETGHVFQQRFKSFPCSDEAYYLSLIAYIHNNPKKAGLVDNAENYEWSSHNEIMNTSKNNLCDVDELFQIIGLDRSNSITSYLWLLGEAGDTDLELENHYMNSEDLELSQSSSWFKEQENIINRRNVTTGEINKAIELVKKDLFLKLKTSDYRKYFTIIATNFSMLSNKEIATYLKISPTRVSNIRFEYSEGKYGKHFDDIIDKISKKFDNNPI